MKLRPAVEVAAFSGANHFLMQAVGLAVKATGLGLLSILTLFSNPLFLLALWLPWAKAWGQKLSEFGFTKRRLALAAAAGLCAALVLLLDDMALEPLYRPALERLVGGDSQAQSTDYSFIRGNLSAYLQWVALIWAFAAFGEEVFFRGLVLRQIELAIGASPFALATAIFGSTILFGAHHWSSGPYAVATSTLHGLVFCAAYLLAGRNIVAPVLAHGAWDTYGLTMLYLDLA